VSVKEGYLHDYLAAGFIGVAFGLIGWTFAVGLAIDWGRYIAGLVLAGLFVFTPGGFVAGYLNFRLHHAGEKLEMEGLSSGFFTAIVYTIITLFLTLARAIAFGNAADTFLAWILSVLFAFIFFLLGGYICGYLERRPFPMPTIFNLSGLSRAPPPPPVAAAQMCPTCGRPMTFIQQYNRWYCSNCKKYP
jgi:MFS family permease